MGKISKSFSIDSEKLNQFLNRCKEKGEDPNHLIEELLSGWTKT